MRQRMRRASFQFWQIAASKHIFLPNERREDNFNELELNVCKSCWLLQLSKTPHLNEMFREYHYLSSASLDTVAHLKDVGDFLIERFPNAKKVLEIGCNDCTLLNILSQNFNQCIGIDPAKNVLDKAMYVYEIILTTICSKSLMNSASSISLWD